MDPAQVEKKIFNSVLQIYFTPTLCLLGFAYFFFIVVFNSVYFFSWQRKQKGSVKTEVVSADDDFKQSQGDVVGITSLATLAY